jgi:hypothetical protein
MSALLSGSVATDGIAVSSSHERTKKEPAPTYTTVQQFQDELSCDWIAAVIQDTTILTYQSLAKGQKSVYRERYILLERFAELARRRRQLPDASE